MESSRASAVVHIALPGHHGQVHVDNLIGVGAGDILKSTLDGGVAVTAIKRKYLSQSKEGREVSNLTGQSCSPD